MEYSSPDTGLLAIFGDGSARPGSAEMGCSMGVAWFDGLESVRGDF